MTEKMRTTANYTVVLTARAANLSAVDWSHAATCYTDGAGNPAGGGFFNLVTMTGDTDGPNNNDACVPVSNARFATQKVTAQELITLAPGQTSVTIDYTITVRNTGNTLGTSPAVLDRPETPPGFTIGSVGHKDGQPIPRNADGTYTVNSGVQLQPFTGRDFVISVTYTIDQTQFTPGSTTNLGVCDVDSTPDRAKGLYNLVTMAGDSDGPDNNDACVPVEVPPQFKVQKAVQGSQPGTTGPTTTVDPNGDVTVTYIVTVTNSGAVAASHPAISDTVTVPTGFTITGVTLGGVTQGTSGGFTIPAGTTNLAPGAATNYTVVLTANAPNLAAVDWAKAGTCNTDGAGTPSDGGFFNLVTMAGDTDGPGNNDACVPVDPPSAKITIEKWGQNCDTGTPECRMPGAAFALYQVDPHDQVGANPIDGAITVNPTDGSAFEATDLQMNTWYWLVETRAPAGHNLLATPVQFRVTGDGIELAEPASHAGVVTVSGENNLTLRVVDQTRGELPMSGGRGPWPNIFVGLMLIAGAAVWAQRQGRAGSAPGGAN